LRRGYIEGGFEEVLGGTVGRLGPLDLGLRCPDLLLEALLISLVELHVHRAGKVG